MANSPPEIRAAEHKTMAKIKEDIEQKIKDAANIVDVLTDDLGVELHRSGAEYKSCIGKLAGRSRGV